MVYLIVFRQVQRSSLVSLYSSALQLCNLLGLVRLQSENIEPVSLNQPLMMLHKISLSIVSQIWIVQLNLYMLGGMVDGTLLCLLK